MHKIVKAKKKRLSCNNKIIYVPFTVVNFLHSPKILKILLLCDKWKQREKLNQNIIVSGNCII